MPKSKKGMSGSNVKVVVAGVSFSCCSRSCFRFGSLRTIEILAFSSLATIIDFGEFESFIYDEPEIHGGGGKGPTPLTGVLAALCACESVTFSRTAKEMAFDYSGIKYQAAFTIDIRGRLGVRDVVPHFQTVKIEARVSTEETASDLAKVVEETEARCPVFNLIKDAGVRINIVWIRQSEETEQQPQ